MKHTLYMKIIVYNI